MSFIKAILGGIWTMALCIIIPCAVVGAAWLLLKLGVAMDIEGAAQALKFMNS